MSCEACDSLILLFSICKYQIVCNEFDLNPKLNFNPRRAKSQQPKEE